MKYLPGWAAKSRFSEGSSGRLQMSPLTNIAEPWREFAASSTGDLDQVLFQLSYLKNMETIYWTCGGVANMVNIIIVRLNSFFLGSHNSQEVTLPRKSQLPCAITFSSSHYPPLHLDWPHAPKKVDPSNYTGPMPPKSFKPGYRSKWQFYRNFEKTYIMTEVPQ